PLHPVPVKTQMPNIAISQEVSALLIAFNRLYAQLSRLSAFCYYRQFNQR
ncbi:MAG: hypothetical protein ACJAUL_003629, partial [Paraglaciecola sp.]